MKSKILNDSCFDVLFCGGVVDSLIPRLRLLVVLGKKEKEEHHRERIDCRFYG